MENSSRFFCNKECEYFPCHDTDDAENFNCLFCYCPLYNLYCGGNYTYTVSGIKDCSYCLIPHYHYDYIVKKLIEHNKGKEEKGDKMLLDFKDATLNLPLGHSVLYLGGGCFWGVEKLFASLQGVESTATGYANGRDDIVPDYKRVCTGDTEYIETVRVVYKSPATLTALAETLFSVIDLTAKNRQGADRGTQYQAAVFYADGKGEEEGLALFERYRKSVQNFSVLFAPIKSFYKAEDYHQKYLEKNPLGYCHISGEEILHAKKKYKELIKGK